MSFARLTNGGLLAREGIWKYTGAVPVMTGSGAQTPTRRQIELLRAWKCKFLVGFPAYLRHMALVARDELGIDPRSLGIKALISHLGVEDRESLEALWGADVFDTYGCNECGTMASECHHKKGLHLFEDAFVMEVNDLETLAPKSPGAQGTIFITTLFKHVAPMIRYNMNDVTSWAEGACSCGTHQRSITKIYGRSDNMVKLRGVNVFPEAIGVIVSEEPRSNGEYVLILERNADRREELTVLVETVDASVPKAGLAAHLAGRFKEVLGVKLKVEAVERGTLDRFTGLSQTSKIKRLIDRSDNGQAHVGQNVMKIFDCIPIGAPSAATSFVPRPNSRARKKSGKPRRHSSPKTNRSPTSEKAAHEFCSISRSRNFCRSRKSGTCTTMHWTCRGPIRT